MFVAVQGYFAAIHVENGMSRADVIYALLAANVNHAAFGMKLTVLPQHHGDHVQRWLNVAVRGLFWEAAAGQHPQGHSTQVSPHLRRQRVGAYRGEAIVPQQGTE